MKAQAMLDGNGMQISSPQITKKIMNFFFYYFKQAS